jgi:predicted dehydrogenase
MASTTLPAPWRGSDSTKAKIKIGQIGVAHGHANKISVYRASKDYEVVGIVEPDADLRSKASQLDAFRGIPSMTQSELLNTPGLQAVLVETRVRDLLSTAEECIDHGLHVHLDKPAGASLSHYERILTKAAQKKLLVQMGYMYRYNPAFLLLRECLKQGWLGDVFEVHAVMSKVLDPAARRELAEFSGGMMFELGCHLIDLVVAILGRPANIESFARSARSDSDLLADNMLSVLEYPNAVATIKSAGVEVDGFDRRHLVVCGTRGTFHIQPLDNPSARVTFDTPRPPYKKGYQDISFPKFARYIADAEDMAKIIRHEKETDFSYDHDLAVQSTVLKASGMAAN